MISYRYDLDIFEKFYYHYKADDVIANQKLIIVKNGTLILKYVTQKSLLVSVKEEGGSNLLWSIIVIINCGYSLLFLLIAVSGLLVYWIFFGCSICDV